MSAKPLINWLLSGDVAVQYQTYRDLLGTDSPDLQKRIATEGWGAEFLARQNDNGHWGQRFYQPKWISTHYTLLDLRNLCHPPDNRPVRDTISMILKEEKGPDGGINPSRTVMNSDVCVNGMALNYASYFGASEESLESVVDFLLGQRMGDGGFNCNSNQCGANHSSLHSTISVAEGIREYAANGYSYRVRELLDAETGCMEFMLTHRLFKSDKTGAVIDHRMTMLSFPSRWRYDILRALDYFRTTGTGYDNRMDDAVEIIMKKRRRDGTWPLQAKHPGQTHFDMEQCGQPSRWNTLRALRAIKDLKIGARPVIIA